MQCPPRVFEKGFCWNCWNSAVDLSCGILQDMSEILSYMSSGEWNYAVDLSCGVLQDMSEILSYMSSGVWSDRRDGLLALQQYLDNENPMS